MHQKIISALLKILASVDGATLIINDENWSVYKIETFEASKSLGSDQWFRFNDDEDSWNISAAKEDFYYFISPHRDAKDRFSKIVMRVSVYGNKSYLDNFGKSIININELNLPVFKVDKFVPKVKVDGTMYSIDQMPEKIVGDLVIPRTMPLGEYNLPNGLQIGGDCNLIGTSLHELPERLVVGGNLDIRGSLIRKLPDELIVGGTLNISNTLIKDIQPRIGAHNVCWKKANTSKLPDNLFIKGNLDIQGSKEISKLPLKLTVGGDLHLIGTSVKSLPEDLIVGGKIYVNVGTDTINCKPEIRKKVVPIKIANHGADMEQIRRMLKTVI